VEDIRRLKRESAARSTAEQKEQDMQPEPMKFDPATGKPKPYPIHAGNWRVYHGKTAWLFNPWSGGRRTPQDVGSDTFGQLIAPLIQVSA